MQAAGVLRDGAAPRDRKGQKQRVQAGIIEPLPDVLPGRQDDTRLIWRDRRETLGYGLALLLAHPGP